MTPVAIVVTMWLTVVTVFRSETMMVFSLMFVAIVTMLSMIMPFRIALAVPTMLAMITLLVTSVVVAVIPSIRMAALRFE